MVMTTKVAITRSEYECVVEQMIKNGYFAHEYVMPPRSILTNVECPICSMPLILCLSGNSHQVTCTSGSCISIGARGL